MRLIYMCSKTQGLLVAQSTKIQSVSDLEQQGCRNHYSHHGMTFKIKKQLFKTHRNHYLERQRLPIFTYIQSNHLKHHPIHIQLKVRLVPSLSLSYQIIAS